MTFTNVFAHIKFSELIKFKTTNSKYKLFGNENHYLGSIFKTNQFDTFIKNIQEHMVLNHFKLFQNC